MYGAYFSVADKEQAVSPEGDSTAPPSQASEHSHHGHAANPNNPAAANAASSPAVPPHKTNVITTRAQHHSPPTAAATASSTAPPPPTTTASAAASVEPRGRGGGTGVIIGDQPPLDVDALLRRGRRDSDDGGEDAAAANNQPSPSKTLTDAEKLRKVITELVDTERAYVRHLRHLMETYLEPLRQEAFLSNAEVGVLFGNIQEIYQFQQGFLRALEGAVDGDGATISTFDQPEQFKVNTRLVC